MPIYEYRCDACGREFEQMRPISSSTQPSTCPECGGTAQKLPSVFASKADYTIKVPRSPAFRGKGAQPANSSSKP